MQRGIELKCESRTPLFAVVDRGELELVLRHVLDNAIKYSYVEGWVEVELSGTEREVQIEIRDSGSGVAKELQESLWEPFVRGEERSVAGSGLGLYLARRIVQRYGGSLVLRDHDSYGVFMITLPRTYPK